MGEIKTARDKINDSYTDLSVKKEKKLAHNGEVFEAVKRNNAMEDRSRRVFFFLCVCGTTSHKRYPALRFTVETVKAMRKGESYPRATKHDETTAQPDRLFT